MSFKIKEDHWLVMVDFMEANKDFACGRFSTANGRDQFKKLWTELTIKLNSLGYGERPVEKWQKSWADLKANLKKKASQIKKWQGQTGGGTEFNKKLTDLELRVLDIIGTLCFEGCGNKEAGLEHIKTVEISAQSNPKLETLVGNARQDISTVTLLKQHTPTSASPEAWSEPHETTTFKSRECVAPGITEVSCSLTESTSKQILRESAPSNIEINQRNPEIDDHDYLPTPRKRMRASIRDKTDTDDIYMQTVHILNNIE